ncbi:MAG: aminotransferase class I/II-fold pyridoxal phosphate-dependent enzyme [bacterium]|nr:aminotransferase class I/II-fold pyridoxal phosphate-dependent enzyme [bacterium]
MIKKIVVDKADRLYQMPLDLASFIPSRQGKLLRRPDTVDLGSFRWPLSFNDDYAIEPKALNPATPERINNLKEELAAWFLAKHQVKLVPEKEIYIGGSISSLVFGLALANLDNGDLAFVPDLGVPLYRKVIVACGGEAVGYSISPKNNWHPDFERINTRMGRVARLLFLNSPHNPTGAELSEKELANLVWLASKENTLVANDAAYQSVPSRLPLSLLAVEGAKRVGIELYSFSYTFGLAPLPFGFAVGNRDAISGLEAASSLMKPSIPEYFVELALRNIRQYPSESLKFVRNRVQQTSAEAASLIGLLSLDVSGFATVPYLWARIERRRSAATLARLLYRRTRIVTIPGTIFGENGQGFLRLSLTAGTEAYEEAASRVKKRASLVRGVEE